MQTDKIIWENAEPWTWQFTVLALKGKDKRHACVGLFQQMELSFKQAPGEERKKPKNKPPQYLSPQTTTQCREKQI